ncbi:MAG: DUF4129 domain-containing protein [Desulfitobacteriaceae bacterium]
MKPLDSLREDLQGILATKEYQLYYHENQNILLDLLKRLKNWLYSILKAIFPQADFAQRTSEWLSYGIAILGVLLFFLLLFLLLARFVRQGRVNPKRAGISKRLTRTVQQHLAEAHRLTEQTEYSLALRHLFLGFIVYLDQNQWIEARAWKTNWEYYAELMDHAPQLANSFNTLAIRFEETMYGGRSIAMADYWSYHNQVNRLIHEGETT